MEIWKADWPLWSKQTFCWVKFWEAGWPLWSKQAFCGSKSRKAAWRLWSKVATLVDRGWKASLDQSGHAAFWVWIGQISAKAAATVCGTVAFCSGRGQLSTWPLWFTDRSAIWCQLLEVPTLLGSLVNQSPAFHGAGCTMSPAHGKRVDSGR